MGLGDQFDFFQYDSDNGTNYAIKLSVAVAAAGGFTGPISPVSNPVYPFGARNMRHVYGSDGTHRTRLPISNASDTLFKTGGTFSLHGRTYAIEGAIGEKRKLNHIG